MTEALDMSLDDILKQSKSQTEKRGSKRGMPVGRRQARSNGARKGLNKNRNNDMDVDDQQPARGRRGAGRGMGVNSMGGVSKGNIRRNREPRRAAYEEVPERSRPYMPSKAPEGKWQHDLYEDDGGARQPRRITAPSQGTKLVINNLDYNVSEDDIKELFETCGALINHRIHYDRSGRSLGTAEVIYVNKADAEKALKSYNNVALDGQKMEIELVTSSPVTMLSSGIKVSGIRDVRDMPAKTKSGLQLTRTFQRGLQGLLPNRGAGGRDARTKLKSAVVRSKEDLDAEMDDFMQE